MAQTYISVLSCCWLCGKRSHNLSKDFALIIHNTSLQNKVYPLTVFLMHISITGISLYSNHLIINLCGYKIIQSGLTRIYKIKSYTSAEKEKGGQG